MMHQFSKTYGPRKWYASVLSTTQVVVEGPLGSIMRLQPKDGTYSNWHESSNGRENSLYTEMLLTARAAAVEAVELGLVEGGVRVPRIIGEQFLLVLGEQIGRENLAKVREENLVGPPDCCASHEYCDANMAMDEAMRDLGIPMDWDSEEGMPQWLCDLWNESWDCAKASLALRGAIPRE